jgi:hypothetical protein
MSGAVGRLAWTMRILPPVLIIVTLFLAGCAVDDPARDRQEETLDTLNAEMPDEDRVAICDGYAFQPDVTYRAFMLRWDDLMTLVPPDEERFDEWMEQDVCPEVAV